MGNLKPGATYEYEHEEGVTYAREKGTSEKTAIGWTYNFSPKNDLEDHNLWIKIRLAAKKNPALQEAVDRVKLLYHLSLQDGTEQTR